MGTLPAQLQFLLDLEGKPSCRVGSVDLPVAMARRVSQKSIGGTMADSGDTAPIGFSFDARIGNDVVRWIMETLSRQSSRRNGSISVLSSGAKTQTRIDFHNALIVEVGIPPVASPSSRGGNLSVKIQPERSQMKTDVPFDPTSLARYGPASSQPWNSGRFKVSIDTLDKECAAVTRVESVVITQGIKKMFAGQSRFPLIEPTRLSESNISLTLPTASAGGFTEWLKGAATGGMPALRSGTLQYSVPGCSTPRFDFRLHGIRPVQLTSGLMGSPGVARAEVSFDQIELARSGGVMEVDLSTPARPWGRNQSRLTRHPLVPQSRPVHIRSDPGPGCEMTVKHPGSCRGSPQNDDERTVERNRDPGPPQGTAVESDAACTVGKYLNSETHPPAASEG